MSARQRRLLLAGVALTLTALAGLAVGATSADRVSARPGLPLTPPVSHTAAFTGR